MQQETETDEGKKEGCVIEDVFSLWLEVFRMGIGLGLAGKSLSKVFKIVSVVHINNYCVMGYIITVTANVLILHIRFILTMNKDCHF